MDVSVTLSGKSAPATPGELLQTYANPIEGSGIVELSYTGSGAIS